MTDLIYLHGFSSSPGGNKGTYTRRWAEAQGIPFHMTSPAWAAYRERGEMEVFHYGLGRPLRLGPELQRNLSHWLDDDTWRIPVPAVILHGRHDEAVPLAEGEANRDRNPGTVLHVLEDDHGLLAPATLECLRNELEAAFR